MTQKQNIDKDTTGYGLQNGHLIFIDDVPSGLACGCSCVKCGRPLIARKGAKNQHHFAHYEQSTCKGAAESALHLLAKELISELATFSVPEYVYTKESDLTFATTQSRQIAKGGVISVDEVAIEKWSTDFIPDIVITSGARALIVEIAVTNFVNKQKMRKIQRRNIPTIEIRLSKSDAFASRARLKEKLEKDTQSKAWLFHPKQRKMDEEYLLELRSLRKAKLRRSSSPTSNKNNKFATLDKFDRRIEQFKTLNKRAPTNAEYEQLWPKLEELNN